MKKVLVAGAALMLVGGLGSTASAAAVEPGVKITGDARVRLGYTDKYHYNSQIFGNRNVGGSDEYGEYKYKGQTNMDSRVRLNVVGTAAGGAYAKARFRMEGQSGDIDNDPAVSQPPINSGNNIWVDLAYIGIPFNDNLTVELGRYRSTYGPMGPTYNFFYDDVSSYGIRGIIKFDNVEINPFIEWMEEAQNGEYTGALKRVAAEDDDVMRYGVHAKTKLNNDWTIGGMLGYQTDSRPERWGNGIQYFEPNEGLFGSLYVSGKAGAFGLNSEVAFTNADLNNFNSWETDTWTVSNNGNDLIGSKDTGYGGYVLPTYTIDKLTLGLNLGFTTKGFQPDRAFGTGVMMGSSDNSRISSIRIGDFGDWLWAGLIVQYQATEALKLTGNFMYADINTWDSKGVAGDGPNTTSASIPLADLGLTNEATNYYAGGVKSAWEVSGILQYTISQGMDMYLSAGYLKPKVEGYLEEDDGVFGALSRFELKF